MPVKLYEWDKNETGWTWIEVTPNKVINLVLRSEDNLIQVNSDNEIYTDLQLASWLTPSSTFPVWVTTGRVLVADGRPATWTVTISKTTSGNYNAYLYGDNWTIYIDNGTWTRKQLLKQITAWTGITISWDTVSNSWVLSVNWDTWAVTISEPDVVSITISEDNWDLRWNITSWTLKDWSPVICEFTNLTTITSITEFLLSNNTIDLIPWISSIANGDVFTWLYREDIGTDWGVFLRQKRTPTP